MLFLGITDEHYKVYLISYFRVYFYILKSKLKHII